MQCGPHARDGLVDAADDVLSRVRQLRLVRKQRREVLQRLVSHCRRRRADAAAAFAVVDPTGTTVSKGTDVDGVARHGSNGRR